MTSYEEMIVVGTICNHGLALVREATALRAIDPAGGYVLLDMASAMLEAMQDRLDPQPAGVMTDAKQAEHAFRLRTVWALDSAIEAFRKG